MRNNMIRRIAGLVAVVMFAGIFEPFTVSADDIWLDTVISENEEQNKDDNLPFEDDYDDEEDLDDDNDDSSDTEEDSGEEEDLPEDDEEDKEEIDDEDNDNDKEIDDENNDNDEEIDDKNDDSGDLEDNTLTADEDETLINDSSVVLISELLVIDSENLGTDMKNNLYLLNESTEIVSEGNLEIVLEDCNVTINSIITEGNLVISGSGELNIVGNEKADEAVKVYGKLEVESGTVNVLNQNGMGIFAEGNILVDGPESRIHTETLNRGIYSGSNITINDRGNIYSEIIELNAEISAVYAEGEIKAMNEGKLWEAYATVIEMNEDFQVEAPFFAANISKLSNYRWNSGLSASEDETSLEWADTVFETLAELIAERNEYVSDEQVFLEDDAVHKISYYSTEDNIPKVLPVSLNRMTVNTNQQLKEALEATGLVQAGETLVLTLSNEFVSNFSDEVTAVINAGVDYHIVIDGGNQILGIANKKTFALTNNSTYTLTVKNLNLNTGTGITLAGSGNYVMDQVTASGLTARVFTLSSATGQVKIVDCILENGTGGVIGGADVEIIGSKINHMKTHAVSDVKKLYVENSLFKGNVAGHGAAINLISGSNTEVVSSSFIDNTGNASGYPGGAIVAEQKSNIELRISKSYFKNNIAANIGAKAGGQGGAVCLYRSYGSYLEVDQCVFNENKSTLKGTISDGGAIAIKNNGDGNETKYLITNSTFYQNTTRDDGGAILLEGTSSTKVTGTIGNCTFMGNVGEADEAGSNGGAVQLYASGAKADFYFNTFYGNKIGGSGVSPTYGGAIGFSGSPANVSSGNLTSNLFIENENVNSNKTKNIYAMASIFTSVSDKGGNVGYDKGSSITYLTAFEAFGTDTPQLKENGEIIEIGCNIDGSSALTTLKTLLIAPEFGANKKGVTASGYHLDERGRIRNKPDAGALDINWVKFDANGGQWADISETAYNSAGDEFSLYNDTLEICDVKYAVDTTDMNNVSTPVQPEYDNYKFIGWSLTRFDINDGAISDCVNPNDLSYEDQTLYAVWQEQGTVVPKEKYKVTYSANGGTGAVTDADSPYDKGVYVTVLGKGNISRNGYKFVGWNTEANGKGISYIQGDTFKIISDTRLYAQWKKIGSPGPGPDPGPDPGSEDKEDKKTDDSTVEDLSAVKQPEILDKENHFAYIVGYPDKTVRPENNITRAEAASIFFRLLSQQYREMIWSKENEFTDVHRGDWFMNAVSTLSHGGILSGYFDGTFRPAESITRAEFASMAVRFSQEEIVTNSQPFTDIKGHWAEDDIIMAYTLGYVSGVGNGEFKPDMPITRGEVASLLNHVLDRHVVSEEDMLPGMMKWSDNTAGKWYYYDIQEATNSHSYTRKADDINEIWISIRNAPDWSILNDPEAQPKDLIVD